MTSLRGAQRRGNPINGLYVITTRDTVTGRSHLDICLAALQGGARIIQYRQKCRAGSPSTPLSRAGSPACRQARPSTPLKEALQLKKLCHEHQALFIVNDQVQLAIDADADGLHLGQNDMDVLSARKLMPNKIIGVSTHSLDEARQAQSLRPDYISAGPIFNTQSKVDASAPIGLNALCEIKKNSNVPVVAIGGINKENAPSVLKAGADAIAVISAISAAEDMVSATRELIQTFPPP